MSPRRVGPKNKIQPYVMTITNGEKSSHVISTVFTESLLTFTRVRVKDTCGVALPERTCNDPPLRVEAYAPTCPCISTGPTIVRPSPNQEWTQPPPLFVPVDARQGQAGHRILPRQRRRNSRVEFHGVTWLEVHRIPNSETNGKAGYPVAGQPLILHHKAFSGP